MYLTAKPPLHLSVPVHGSVAWRYDGFLTVFGSQAEGLCIAHIGKLDLVIAYLIRPGKINPYLIHFKRPVAFKGYPDRIAAAPISDHRSLGRACGFGEFYAFYFGKAAVFLLSIYRAIGFDLKIIRFALF